MFDVLYDPVIQLVIIVLSGIVVYDVSKFILTWVWKKIGGKGDL